MAYRQYHKIYLAFLFSEYLNLVNRFSKNYYPKRVHSETNRVRFTVVNHTHARRELITRFCFRCRSYPYLKLYIQIISSTYMRNSIVQRFPTVLTYSTTFNTIMHFNIYERMHVYTYTVFENDQRSQSPSRGARFSAGNGQANAYIMKTAITSYVITKTLCVLVYMRRVYNIELCIDCT